MSAETQTHPVVLAMAEHKDLVLEVLHDFERAVLAGTLVETSYPGYAYLLMHALMGERR